MVPAVGETTDERAAFESDEDAIDTAPTRVPTEAELAEGRPEAAESDDWFSPLPEFGRHSVGDSGANWRMDLDETDAPRRRHSAEEISTWTAAVDDADGAVEIVEEVVEVESVVETEVARRPVARSRPRSRGGRPFTCRWPTLPGAGRLFDQGQHPFGPVLHPGFGAVRKHPP